VRIGLVLPGFSADAQDWCIPALRHFVQRLSRGDELEVLALRYPYRADSYALFGARVTALGGGQRRGLGSAAVWGRALTVLLAEHRRQPFDLLHAFWANETGALVAVAGRLLHIPAVVSLAGGELVGFADIGYGGQLARGERARVRLALRLASVVTAGSRSLLTLAGPHLGPRQDRAHYLPLGVDLDLFRPFPLPPPAGPPRLLQVASLSPIKDQATLLRATDTLRRRGFEFVLELVGGGPLEPTLRGLCHSLGLAARVHFPGPRPHHDLPALYRRASLFVLSSRHEAQSMVALEAAACGAPVVGTRVGIIPDLAPQAATAVPVGDSHGLAAAMASILSDPARAHGLGQAARQRVEAEFELGQCTERFRQLYRSLLGQPEAVRHQGSAAEAPGD
jgi:glycosyltransferase involved in cell wall biosynthesis